MPGSTGALYQEEGLSGSAWAETSSAASFSGNWSDVLASGSIGVSGTGSVHASDSYSAGYYGAGSFAVLGSFGTLYGVVTASESGAAKYNEKWDTQEEITGSGVWTPTSASGSGSESGGSSFSYSGSALWVDSTAASGINFLTPGSVSANISGSSGLWGTASAEGSAAASYSGSWNDSLGAGGTIVASGSGWTDWSDTNSASYSGSASFAVTGAVNGRVWVNESGNVNSSQSAQGNYEISGSTVDWTLTSVSGGGSQSGSTSWSYSGSGSYTDANATSGISFFTPSSAAATFSGTISGVASASGQVTSNTSLHWNDSEGSGSATDETGGGSIDLTDTANDSYAGTATFNVAGAVVGQVTVNESGNDNFSDDPDDNEEISGSSGSMTLESVTGNGSDSGSTSWSYSGSGSYTDANATSGISFFTPSSAAATFSGTLTGIASASGQVIINTSLHWNDSEGSDEVTDETGGGSIDDTDTANDSYAGMATFNVAGVVAGLITVNESGNDNFSDDPDDNEEISGSSGSMTLESVTGNGSDSGSTSWSYSGSGNYTDASATSGISFFTPGSAAATFSGTLTGVASASGQVIINTSLHWNDSEGSGGVTDETGGGSIDDTDTANDSYAGTATFNVAGAVVGQVMVNESGNDNFSDDPDDEEEVSGNDSWMLEGVTGNGFDTGSTSWSYSGSGNYSDANATSGISFFTPSSAAATFSGTLTGIASASGQVIINTSLHWNDSEGSDEVTDETGGGSIDDTDTANDSYAGMATFNVAGVVAGLITVNESGNDNFSDDPDDNEEISGSSGSMTLESVTGNGSDSGSTSWSYSGSGNYTDASATSGISFFTPSSAAATFSGTLTGVASASGQVTSNTSLHWNDSEGSDEVTDETGGGSIDDTDTANDSYAGMATFNVAGAVVGLITVNESGNDNFSDDPDDNEEISGSSGSMTLESVTGNGSDSGSTSWSYSGSGSYTDANATSGISFFTPGSAAPTFSGSVTGTAYASGSVTTSTSGSWSDSLSGSVIVDTGSGTIDTADNNDASYMGFGTLTLLGAIVGSVHVNESGTDDFSDDPYLSEEISGSSGSWTLDGVSGGGSVSGSTSWSYSGSGAYTDANATSGITFFTPGSAQPTFSGSVTGTAYASGSVTGSTSGSWGDSLSVGTVAVSGSGTIDTGANNDASYTGFGTLTLLGAVVGSVQVNESGTNDFSDDPDLSEEISGSSGSWTLEDVTGGGSVSGSTSWSYSGSGAYTDANATNGISFFTPGSAQPTFSGSVTGTAYASGSVTGSTSGSWTDSLSGGVITDSGSGSIDTTVNSDASYTGLGTLALLGAVVGSAQVNESGTNDFSVSPDETEEISGSSGSWTLEGVTGGGSTSGSTSWSYSGSGDYIDANATSGISFFTPGGDVTPTFSGSVTGTAYASGSVTTSASGSLADGLSGSAITVSGSGSIDVIDNNDASYTGFGDLTLTGAVAGNVQVNESGNEDFTDDPDESEELSGSSGSWTLEGITGSGSAGGSTSWSYSGSGGYTDSNAASGIDFFTPGGTAPAISGTVAGSAFASGSVSTSMSGSWTNSDSGGSLTDSGSGSISTTTTNYASYSGSGTLTLSGAVAGSVQVKESGNNNVSDSPTETLGISGSGSSWTPQSASGSGSNSGSTSWSYSGSGSYIDANAGSGISFFTPSGAAPSISGMVSGTASASGSASTTTSGNWVDSLVGGLVTGTGSASVSESTSNDASYTGSGILTLAGAVVGSVQVKESGDEDMTDAPQESEEVSGSTVTVGSVSGNGSTSGSTSWSYSGSGSYADANAASGIDFFTPGSAAPGVSGTVTGTAYASGSLSTSTSGSWTDSFSGGSITDSGAGSVDASASNDASYTGSGTLALTGAVVGSVQVNESGTKDNTDTPDETEEISGSSWTPESVSGGGSTSGSTSWSYSGSGSYVDANGASGINFFTPSSAAPTITGSVTGSAWASGSLGTSNSGSWTDSLSGSVITDSGSGSIDITASNDASYSGGGTLSLTGAIVGSVQVNESGNDDYSDDPDEDEDISGSNWIGESVSGSGSTSGSTSWSYSGSGSYVDANGASGINFFTPGGAAPTISGSVTGSAWASGSVGTSMSGSWTDSLSGSAITESGSGTIDGSDSNDASYSGGGTLSLTGAVVGSVQVNESGNDDYSDDPDEDEDISGSSWNDESVSGGGSTSGSTSWSYSGSGNYTDANGASDISFFIPGGAAPTISGSVMGTAYASGSLGALTSGSWTDSLSGSAITESGSGTIDDSETNDASYTGAGTLTLAGAVVGSVQVNESGTNDFDDDPDEDEEISSTGWTLDDVSGGGSDSGSTSWSYSGSGGYTDANAARGISFFTPAGDVVPTFTGSVTGTAFASGSLGTSTSGSWSNSLAGSAIAASGSGTIDSSASNDASYTGSGTLTLSGAVVGSVQVNESGSNDFSDDPDEDEEISDSGSWTLEDVSGSGSDSGSTSWSYSGFGSYVDANATSGISFFTPAGAVVPTFSGSVTGSAYASGSLGTSTSGSWSDSLSGSAIAASGSGALDTTSSNDASYTGSGILTLSGAVVGSVQVNESGNNDLSDNPDEDEQISGSGWTVDGVSSGGWDSGSTSWSYTGSGSYVDANATSGISFLTPGGGTTAFSGSLSGTAWASGQTTGSTSGSWNDVEGSNGAVVASGSGTIDTDFSNDASYSGTAIFGVSGAVSGRVTVTESGRDDSNDSVNSGDEISGAGSFTLDGGFGSGSTSGSIYWSYSGSGSYSDANGTSGISFDAPGAGATTITGSVTGSAWASGSVTGIISGNWASDETASGSFTTAGASTTTISTTITNYASYSGSGTFTSTGGISGGGTIREGGNQETFGSADSTYNVNLSQAEWVLQGGTGGGSQSGSTFWSYSGSGTYTDGSAADAIGSLLPASAASLTTLAGTATGVASASGAVTTSNSGSWTQTESAGGGWSYSGAGSTTTTRSNSATYEGSGSFATTGEITGGGTLGESGSQTINYLGVNSYSAGTSGNWVLSGSTGSGTTATSDTRTYSGSGSYPDGSPASGMSGTVTSSSSGPATWTNASMPAGLAQVAVEILKTSPSFMRACFTAGTPLLTPAGDKPIEQFQVGDAVLSRPEGDANGPTEARIVEEVFVRWANVWRLCVGGQVIETTAEHPFWVLGRGWTPTFELHVGDVLVSHDGQQLPIHDLVKTGREAAVYNLCVSEWHTYFVGSRNWGFSVWAHNEYGLDNLWNDVTTTTREVWGEVALVGGYVVANPAAARAEFAAAVSNEAIVIANDAQALAVALPGKMYEAAKEKVTYVLNHPIEAAVSYGKEKVEEAYEAFLGPIVRTALLQWDIPLALINPSYQAANPILRAFLNKEIGFGRAWFEITSDAVTSLLTIVGAGPAANRAFNWGRRQLFSNVSKLRSAVASEARVANSQARACNAEARALGKVGCFVAGTPTWISVPQLAAIACGSSGASIPWHDESAEPSHEVVPIESVALGQRVPSRDPGRDGDAPLPEPDYSGWKVVSMEVENRNGSIVDVHLLRPQEWVQRNGLYAGVEVNLRMTELEVDAIAYVVSVREGPEILPGDGAVVIGRFVTRAGGDLVRVTFADGTQLTGTRKHPVWSPLEQEWRGLGEFEPGQSVQSRSGLMPVTSVEDLPGFVPLFNIEVDSEHVYEVTALGILVHNNPECPWEELERLRGLAQKTEQDLARIKELEKQLARENASVRNSRNATRDEKQAIVEENGYRERGKRVPGDAADATEIGDGFRDELATRISKNPNVEQVRTGGDVPVFETPSGPRKFDIEVTLKNGRVIYLEAKAGTAGVDAGQAQKDAWLRETGVISTVVRQNR